MDILLKVFIAFVVIQNVQTQSRPVVNTTCLELAKPSNQQYRLICSHYDYHCLLDESYTKEFEVCREWKWIPGGKCAYFNTYGSGNVDERQCKSGINLTCSESKRQFESKTNTQFTACYAKRGSITSFSTSTSPIQVTSNMTSDRFIATSSPASYAWIIFFLYIIAIAGLLTIAVIFAIYRYMDKPLCIKENGDKKQEQQSFVENKNDNTLSHPERQETVCQDDETSSRRRKDKTIRGRIGNDDGKTSDAGLDPLISRNVKEYQEETTNRSLDVEYHGHNKNCDKKQEQQSFVENKNDNTVSHPERQETVCQDDEISSRRRKDNTIRGRLGNDDGKTSDASLNLMISKNVKEYQEETTNRSLDVENHDHNDFQSLKSDNEEEKEDESTDKFDDTIESLQRIPPSTVEQGREYCAEFQKLLDTEGLKRTQEIMAATITKETEKSVKTLLNTLTVQDENTIKEVLPEQSHRIFDSEKERETSFYVLYGLNRIFLEKKHHPISGWGNPVREQDIGIGDDIERLYRIQTIVCEISKDVTVSVESYIRLLDIMRGALTRLNHYTECKGEIEALALEIKRYKDILYGSADKK